MNTAKILIAGPPNGPQGDMISAISEVRVKSTARTTTGDDFVPVDFGRVRLPDGMDLQLYGVAWESVETVLEAVSPGVIGAMVIVGRADEANPRPAADALERLLKSGVPAIVARRDRWAKKAIRECLQFDGRVIDVSGEDKDNVKQALIAVFESAVESAPAA